MAAALAVGCGNASEGTSSSATSTPASSTPKASAPAASQQPDVTVSAKWKDGVTEANRGDKTGKVRLQGTVPAANGTVLYLYETEGRNLTLMDSAKVQNQAFDFGQVEVHRGFYQLATDNAKNNCQFVMNPDEPQVNLKFRSKQLTSSKTAEGSQENAAWFTYDSCNQTVRKRFEPTFTLHLHHVAAKVVWKVLLQGERFDKGLYNFVWLDLGRILVFFLLLLLLLVHFKQSSA